MTEGSLGDVLSSFIANLIGLFLNGFLIALGILTALKVFDLI